VAATFALLLDRCGLSIGEAAQFLDVRPDTIKSWSSGRRTPPPDAVAQLCGLYDRIERAAGALVAAGRDVPGPLSVPRDMIPEGLPSRGAADAALGLVAARRQGRLRVE
jgi:hypothetical protein